MLEVKKVSTIAYRIYDYLTKNCVGKENRTKVADLREMFGLDRRTTRKVLSEINTYMEFDKVICRVGGIYVSRNNDELQHYLLTRTKSALSTLHEVSCARKKGQLDQQTKMKLGKYFKDARECFEECDK